MSSMDLSVLGIRELVPEGVHSLLGKEPVIVETRSAYELAGGYGSSDPDLVLQRVRLANVRGCGGAGFPTARKIEVVQAASNPKRVLVVNGAESEPTSLKDRYLMRFRPHLILDGARLLGQMLGSELVFIVVGDEQSKTALNAAVADADLGFKPRIHLLRGKYVKGEETAVIAALNGRKPLPQFKPPRPFERGVANLPTLVLNAETVAQVALLGVSEISAGKLPRLATVTRRHGRASLISCHRGVEIAAVAGVSEAAPASVMPSGFFGGLVPWDLMTGATVADWEEPTAVGVTGSLGMVVIGEDDCPVAAVAESAHYLAGENASQCGSCVNGTVAAANALTEVAKGTATAETMSNLQRWSGMLPGRGACAVPDGLARLLRDLLSRFEGTIKMHGEGGCSVCPTLTFTYGRYDSGVDGAALDQIEGVR